MNATMNAKWLARQGAPTRGAIKGVSALAALAARVTAWTGGARRTGLIIMRTGALLIGIATCANAYSASKTVLVLGDSLSAEYGLARGSGWVALLEQRLAHDNIAAHVVNASISGDTTSGGNARLPALLAQYQPQVVVVELGGNDGLRGLPLAASEANFRSMISKAQQAHAKVLLVGMRLPPNFGRSYTERFYSMYGKLAKENKTALVPFMLDGIAEKPQLFQADRIHPVAAAHPAILDNIWPHLKPLL